MLSTNKIMSTYGEKIKGWVMEGHEFINVKCETPIFCDGGEDILNNILGCSPFRTMGIMKGVGRC
jgi:hypothetical protein